MASGDTHADDLRAYASRLGYAVRKALPRLSEAESIRLVSPVVDVLDDLGIALAPRGDDFDEKFATASSGTKQEISLLAALAIRDPEETPVVSGTGGICDENVLPRAGSIQGIEASLSSLWTVVLDIQESISNGSINASPPTRMCETIDLTIDDVEEYEMEFFAASSWECHSLNISEHITNICTSFSKISAHLLALPDLDDWTMAPMQSASPRGDYCSDFGAPCAGLVFCDTPVDSFELVDNMFGIHGTFAFTDVFAYIDEKSNRICNRIVSSESEPVCCHTGIFDCETGTEFDSHVCVLHSAGLQFLAQKVVHMSRLLFLIDGLCHNFEVWEDLVAAAIFDNVYPDYNSDSDHDDDAG